jgi:hypothetical protein
VRAATLVLLTTACGTYSHLRPADNLRAGGVEISGGFAASTLPEVVPVVQAAVGITDWMELEAQYEVYSALGELRFELLGSERRPIALALGVGGGVASVWKDVGDDHLRAGAVLGDLVLGKGFRHVDLYLANKTVVLVSVGYVINAVKAGVRARWKGLHLGVEGGVTTHHSFFALGEGTVYLGFGL